MIKEMSNYSSSYQEKISTVYFGGGTPSLLDNEDFTVIMDAVEENFNIADLDEFTLECNPEDLSPEKMEHWKSRGVDRLSIGVQSFQDDILRSINRQHTKDLAIKGIEMAKEMFDRISIDIIVGLPGLDIELLKDDLALIMSFDPQHVSAYQLSVEEKTSLAYDIKQGKIKLLSDEAINDQYRLLHKLLCEKGYNHYEVSNYAKVGLEAVHNSSYWSGESYLGIGPGAHSYLGRERRWNVSNNIQYARKLEQGHEWYESEKLSNKDRFNEKIMISLRTSKGLSLSSLAKEFPDLYSLEIEEKAILWEEKGWASRTGDLVLLSLEGWLISDRLASDLFIV